MNLCPLCKSNHDKKHKIINYAQKFYVCKKHVRMIYVYYAKKIIDCIKLYHMMMLFRRKKLLEKMR